MDSEKKSPIDGFKCPKCGNVAAFEIGINGTAVYAAGSDVPTLVDDGFDDEYPCTCTPCGYHSDVAKFRRATYEQLLTLREGLIIHYLTNQKLRDWVIDSAIDHLSREQADHKIDEFKFTSQDDLTYFNDTAAELNRLGYKIEVQQIPYWSAKQMLDVVNFLRRANHPTEKVAWADAPEVIRYHKTRAI